MRNPTHRHAPPAFLAGAILAALACRSIQPAPTVAPPNPPPAPIDAGRPDTGQKAGSIAGACAHLCALPCPDYCPSAQAACEQGLVNLRESGVAKADLACLAAVPSCLSATDCIK